MTKQAKGKDVLGAQLSEGSDRNQSQRACITGREHFGSKYFLPCCTSFFLFIFFPSLLTSISDSLSLPSSSHSSLLLPLSFPFFFPSYTFLFFPLSFFFPFFTLLSFLLSLFFHSSFFSSSFLNFCISCTGISFRKCIF